MTAPFRWIVAAEIADDEDTRMKMFFAVSHPSDDSNQSERHAEITQLIGALILFHQERSSPWATSAWVCFHCDPIREEPLCVFVQKETPKKKRQSETPQR